MKKLLTLFAICQVLLACSGTGGGSSGSSAVPLPDGGSIAAQVGISGTNVIPVSVSSGYVNEPVVTVKVCEPGSTTNCTTIPNVLLDTGSSGLRIFSSLVSSLNLPQVMINGAGTGTGTLNLAKCTYYGDGTKQWGPVKTADVLMGSETASSVNIQIIDASYKTVPTDCSNPESSPTTAQYNGILGVGVRDRDCGSTCVGSTTKLYFACGASTCARSAAPATFQVQNPVAALTASSNSDHTDDSNGSMLMLPTIPDTGANSVSGWLIFGIGTRGAGSNNDTTGMTMFLTDSDGYFFSKYSGGSDMDAFIDSGSNGLYLPTVSQTPNCMGSWFCPDGIVSLQATQKDYLKVVSQNVNFKIIDARQVFVSNNQAYSDLGGDGGSTFDWGLPFFFGRPIFTGIDGKTSTVNGTGNSGVPFYAY